MGGLAREPVTIAAVLTASTPLIIAIARLIEQWMRSQDENTKIRLVWQAAREDKDIAEALAALAKEFGKLDVQRGHIGTISNQKKLHELSSSLCYFRYYSVDSEGCRISSSN